jgi:transposase InsO family protein
MAPLCREFGISRVTGYKIFKRYKDCGLEALYDRSRAPYRQANRLPYQVERTILGIKKAHPSWGAPKIRDKLIRQFPMIKPPAISTIHAVLDRHGLVKRRKRRRYKAQGTELVAAHEPNGLWCADYKGEFMLGNRKYCYPLTISDYRSRYLIACEGLKSTKSDFAFSVFERAFKDFGLPSAIRTDNGVPFASGNALFGLTRLAVWACSASSPAIPSRTAVTSASTSRSRRKPPNPPPSTSCSSRSASTTSSGFTTTSDPTRRSVGPTRVTSIHLQAASTNRQQNPITRTTIGRSA